MQSDYYVNTSLLPSNHIGSVLECMCSFFFCLYWGPSVWSEHCKELAEAVGKRSSPDSQACKQDSAYWDRMHMSYGQKKLLKSLKSNKIVKIIIHSVVDLSS